jgi:hypothetical protein
VHIDRAEATGKHIPHPGSVALFEKDGKCFSRSDILKMAEEWELELLIIEMAKNFRGNFAGT